MGEKPAGVGTMAGEVIDELKRRGDVKVVLFRSEAIGRGPLKHVRLARAIKTAKLDAFWQPGGWLPFFLPHELVTVQTVHDLISLDHPEWFPNGASRDGGRTMCGWHEPFIEPTLCTRCRRGRGRR